ncbi:penicillin binding protein transpeptidase domain-containing protein [Ditylenchus destructor]|uniref:Penicillin binding protein transpeptidase domain-containing protein n=1 Tax=Ditylenchus destructor TaxID=166010 RepID=A0AAD4MGE0_9BILA|nr:penicillin binding protein transpeptidase domain-containing protein [Ditylenchus destructor]
MQGGFDATVQAFNRATQAQRQPGSTIKPIVYSAALENGMTPASIIVDGPFCVYQGAGLGNKCFRNFGGTRGAGPKTMRWGIEQSRNLMTVQAANTTGMEKVGRSHAAHGRQLAEISALSLLFARRGRDDGDADGQRLFDLVNHGRALTPSLVDFAQDRKGKVIWPQNWRACDRCNMPDWDGKPMPRPVIRSRQVVDAMTAYQMVHITEGVIQRGTATICAISIARSWEGAGTSNGPRDVWFIGGTPQMIAGLYLGYAPTHQSGGYAQGGTLAAPIFKHFAQKAYEGLDVLPLYGTCRLFPMVRIDRASGRRVYGAWPGADPKAAVIGGVQAPERKPPAAPAAATKPRLRRPKRPGKPCSGTARATATSCNARGGIY